MLSQDIENWNAWTFVGRLRLEKNRALNHLQPNEQSDSEQQNAHQERYAPSPTQKRRLLHRRGKEKNRVRKQQPHWHARLYPAGVKTAPLVSAVLHGHEHSTSPLTTNADALQKSEQYQ